jgi:methyl acetate hydrolase
MSDELKRSADAILERVVNDEAPVAGMAATATDRDGSIYEGAAGVRTLGSAQPFTTDTVCAIFSTTSAAISTSSPPSISRSRCRRDVTRSYGAIS